MHWIVIDQAHMFLQTMVHECDAVCTAWIGLGQKITLFFKPLNLVTSDTVHASGSQAVCPTSAKEPETNVGLVTMDCILNR